MLISADDLTVNAETLRKLADDLTLSNLPARERKAYRDGIRFAATYLEVIRAAMNDPVIQANLGVKSAKPSQTE